MQTPETTSKIPGEGASPRLPPPPPAAPQPIPLTARERDILQAYFAKRGAAKRQLDDAEVAIAAVCQVIVERAGGDLAYGYTVSPDATALVPKEN